MASRSRACASFAVTVADACLRLGFDQPGAEAAQFQAVGRNSRQTVEGRLLAVGDIGPGLGVEHRQSAQLETIGVNQRHSGIEADIEFARHGRIVGEFRDRRGHREW